MNEPAYIALFDEHADLLNSILSMAAQYEKESGTGQITTYLLIFSSIAHQLIFMGMHEMVEQLHGLIDMFQRDAVRDLAAQRDDIPTTLDGPSAIQ